jgi:hypothetical protein
MEIEKKHWCNLKAGSNIIEDVRQGACKGRRRRAGNLRNAPLITGNGSEFQLTKKLRIQLFTKRGLRFQIFFY